MIPSPVPGADIAAGEAKAPKELGFDALKGVGILSVLGIHSFNNSARLYLTPQSQSWLLLSLANRILNFAVPLFLIISAVLYARSQSARGTWDGYFGRRLKTILYPYLVWTLLYLIFRFRFGGIGSDHADASLFGLHGPKLWLDWRNCLNDLVWGKAAFHLYFLSILIQFAIVFPLLYRWVRRIPGGFWASVGVGFAVQAVIFWANKHVYTLKYPGATVLWYVSALLPAIWIGMNFSRWNDVWQRSRIFIAGATILSGGVFLIVSARDLRGLPFSGDVSNYSLQVYSFVASLVLLGLIATPWQTSISASLAKLGTISIQVYLVHPIFMKLMETSAISGRIRMLPFPFFWAYLMLLALSLLAAEIFTRAGLDGLLFGRWKSGVGGSSKAKPPVESR